jgi:hypothetical protein
VLSYSGSEAIAMTKKTKKHRKRPPSGKRTAANAPFQIVVAAHPGSVVSLAPELDLVKAALLYGDRVTLLSPVATMLMRAQGLKTLSQRQLLELVRRVAPYLVEPGEDVAAFEAGLDQLDQAIRSGGRGGAAAQRLVRSELTRKFEPTRQQLADIVETMSSDTGVDQLDLARAKGLVQIENVDPGDSLDLIASCVIAARLAETGRRNEDGFTDRVVETFVDRLSRHLSSGREYLIFDDQIASLTESAIREGIFTPASGPSGRSAQAMTASALMGRLPTFPNATVDEVLDIRTELAPSLTQFRGGMVTISKSFTSDAWEAGFEDEVHDAWVETVRPAVEAIEHSVRENGSLLSIVSGIADAANTSYPGLALFGAGLVGQVPPVALVGATLAAGAPILEAFREHRAGRRDIRMQPFYFLYGLQEGLD